jgi:branched-chain amino acid aminotransferase
MYEHEPGTIWWNGDLVPWEEARVHVTSEVATRGANVFEGVRAYRQVGGGPSALVHPARHFARLARSARLLRFPAEQVAAHLARMQDGIGELVRALGPDDLYLRPTIYIERGRYGWRSSDTELGSYIAGYPTGVHPDRPLACIVSSWRRGGDLALSPLVKAGAAYQAFRLPRIEAAQAGADEAILLNQADTVAETGGATVFIVRDGAAVTPPLADAVLDGITRGVVIELLKGLGVQVVERSIPRTELYVAEEAFLCGTLDEVRAIGSIDGVELGRPSGPVTAAVRGAYLDACTGRCAAPAAEMLVTVAAAAVDEGAA